MGVLKRISLTSWIVIGLVAGIAVGQFWPDIGLNMAIFSKIFLRMIKSIIAPLLFATLVTGIAGWTATLWGVGELSAAAEQGTGGIFAVLPEEVAKILRPEVSAVLSASQGRVLTIGALLVWAGLHPEARTAIVARVAAGLAAAAIIAMAVALSRPSSLSITSIAFIQSALTGYPGLQIPLRIENGGMKGGIHCARPSQPGVHRFAFHGQHAKDGFMHAAQRFLAHKAFQGFDAQGEFAQGQ